MPRRIQGPDGKVHEFPDDFSDDEIATALDTLLPPVDSSRLETPAPTWAERLGLNKPTASAILGFMRGSTQGAVDVAQGVASRVTGAMNEKLNAENAIRQDAGVSPTATMPQVEKPQTFSGTIGSVLPDVASMAMPVGEAAAAVKGAVPSTARAGAKFQSVMAAAKDLPVAITDDVSKATSRIYELSENGATLPSAVRKFFIKATNPEKPIDYKTARDFITNMGSLSADEASRMSPTVRRELINLTKSLGDSVVQTAKQAGKADEYLSAVKEYRRAMRMRETLEAVKGPALKGAAGAAGAGAGYEIYRRISGE